MILSDFTLETKLNTVVESFDLWAGIQVITNSQKLILINNNKLVFISACNLTQIQVQWHNNSS